MASIADEISQIEWFHPFDFGGVHTHSPEASAHMHFRAERIFKHPVAGLSVIDIGAWDGFFSFEAEKRGAARVLATDHFCWSGPGWGTKAGFDLAHRLLASKIESRDIAVEALTPAEVGQWDVTLYLGVLYHSPDPLGDLKRVAALTRKMAVIETVIEKTWSKRPLIRYVHGDSSNPHSIDPTNFFVPNPSAVEAMLRTVGFSRIEMMIDKKLSRGIFHAFKA